MNEKIEKLEELIQSFRVELSHSVGVFGVAENPDLKLIIDLQQFLKKERKSLGSFFEEKYPPPPPPPSDHTKLSFVQLSDLSKMARDREYRKRTRQFSIYSAIYRGITTRGSHAYDINPTYDAFGSLEDGYRLYVRTDPDDGKLRGELNEGDFQLPRYEKKDPKKALYEPYRVEEEDAIPPPDTRDEPVSWFGKLRKMWRDL